MRKDGGCGVRGQRLPDICLWSRVATQKIHTITHTHTLNHIHTHTWGSVNCLKLLHNKYAHTYTRTHTRTHIRAHTHTPTRGVRWGCVKLLYKKIGIIYSAEAKSRQSKSISSKSPFPCSTHARYYSCIYTCIYTCMNLYIVMYIYACVYTCIYIDVCVDIYICIYM